MSFIMGPFFRVFLSNLRPLIIYCALGERCVSLSPFLPFTQLAFFMHVHYYHCWPPNCHSSGPNLWIFSSPFLPIFACHHPISQKPPSHPIFFFAPCVKLHQPLMISDENVQKAESFAQFFMPRWVGRGVWVGLRGWGLQNAKNLSLQEAGCWLPGSLGK